VEDTANLEDLVIVVVPVFAEAFHLGLFCSVAPVELPMWRDSLSRQTGGFFRYHVVKGPEDSILGHSCRVYDVAITGTNEIYSQRLLHCLQ
jgi:hypothetical protein